MENFNYMMLSRLIQDCKYFLGNGNRHEKNLWAGDVNNHILEIKKIWKMLKIKPDWLSYKKIKKYELEMKKDSHSKKYNKIKKTKIFKKRG